MQRCLMLPCPALSLLPPSSSFYLEICLPPFPFHYEPCLTDPCVRPHARHQRILCHSGSLGRYKLPTRTRHVPSHGTAAGCHSGPKKLSRPRQSRIPTLASGSYRARSHVSMAHPAFVLRVVSLVLRSLNTPPPSVVVCMLHHTEPASHHLPPTGTVNRPFMTVQASPSARRTSL